jgi:pyridoxal phosphate enzyme (YggS family)
VNGAPLSIRVRLDEIRQRIERAAVRSGRAPEQVRLVGASKTAPTEVLAEVIRLGLKDLGENRVQEAERKQLELGTDGVPVRWHMIGPLQRNKVKKAVEIFDVIHSVNGLALAEEISRRAHGNGVTSVLVEVNVSDEPTKFGIAPDQVEPLLEQVRTLPGLQVDGLMTIGRPVEQPGEARRDFAALRELRDRCERSLGLQLPELSMGMSGDFEVAIEEGATLVRVGTALFGTRS